MLDLLNHQVLLGSRGYAIQKFNRLEKDKNRWASIFVPIVVTTAKLMVCDISSEDIDLDGGIVKDQTKIKLRIVPWVVYNYKPNFMLNADSQKIQLLKETKTYSNESESLDYVMSTYIVNAGSLNDFLEKIVWIGSN